MFLSSISSQSSRPSFFEMLAQAEMTPALKPALKYSLSVFAQRNPSLLSLYNWSDEIFAACALWLEHHHLKHYDASFSENFYGLKRFESSSPFLSNNGSAPAARSSPSVPPPTSVLNHSNVSKHSQSISDAKKYIALILLVVVPYIKDKLDVFYKSNTHSNYSFNILSHTDTANTAAFPPSPSVHASDQQSSSSSSSSASTSSSSSSSLRFSSYLRNLRRLFLTYWLFLYPYLNFVYEGSFFVCMLLYLYGKTEYYTPFLYLQKLSVRRLTSKEMKDQVDLINAKKDIRILKLRGGPMMFIARALVRLYHLTLDASKLLLPLSIFGIKFLEWYYTESKLTVDNQQIEIPAPPSEPKVREGVNVPSHSLCAICNHSISNPTQLTESNAIYNI